MQKRGGYTQAQRMKRLGELLSGDLTRAEQEEYMALGVDFLCAVASDLDMTDCTVKGTEAAVAGHSGRIHLDGRAPKGCELVVELKQDYLTFQEAQTCLYCRPKAIGTLELKDCHAVGIPMLLSGDYAKLLCNLRKWSGKGGASEYSAA